MYAVDIPIEALVFFLGHLFSGLLGIAYRAQNKNDAVINVFLLARLFDVLAWGFMGIQGWIPVMLATIVGNTFFIFGSALQIKALLLIKKRFSGSVPLILVIFTVVMVLTVTATSLSGLSPNIQTAARSLALAFLWVYPTCVLLFERNSSTLQKFVATTYAISMIPHLLHAYFGLAYAGSDPQLDGSLTGFPFFTTMYVVMLVGNLGLILMSKESADSSLAHAAAYDELTGIYNRRTFMELTQQALNQCARSQRPLSYLTMDLDLFKHVNDVYGHFAGDQVLKSFANVVRSQLRFRDVLGRIGGEEFTLLLPETDEKGGRIVAERIRQAAENDLVNGEIHYTVSSGLVTTTNHESTTLDMLYKASDIALYEAKSNGRNRIETGTVTKI